jgi:hypothetical protein
MQIAEKDTYSLLRIARESKINAWRVAKFGVKTESVNKEKNA